MRRAVALVLAAVVLAGACSSSSSPSSDAKPSAADLTRRGPYAVGITTLLRPDAPVEVWYPAAGQPQEADRFDVRSIVPASLAGAIPAGVDVRLPTFGARDARVADGRFPVVLFSHGFAGYRLQSASYTARLASWGYVVASTEHRRRNLEASFARNPTGPGDAAELRAVLDLLAAAPGRLRGHVDLGHLATTGHSAGGNTAVSFAAADDRVDAVVGLAPAITLGAPRPAARVRVLLVAGSQDTVVNPAGPRLYASRRSGTAFAVVDGMGHLQFTDVCRLKTLDVAGGTGVTIPPVFAALTKDGCEGDKLTPDQSTAAITALTVAELRLAFGQDGPSLRDVARALAPSVKVSLAASGIGDTAR